MASYLENVFQIHFPTVSVEDKNRFIAEIVSCASRTRDEAMDKIRSKLNEIIKNLFEQDEGGYIITDDEIKNLKLSLGFTGTCRIEHFKEGHNIVGITIKNNNEKISFKYQTNKGNWIYASSVIPMGKQHLDHHEILNTITNRNFMGWPVGETFIWDHENVERGRDGGSWKGAFYSDNYRITMQSQYSEKLVTTTLIHNHENSDSDSESTR